MSAGHWSSRVTVQVFTGRDDGVGGQDEDWNDLVSCWMSIQPINAAQVLRAGALQTEITHFLRCAYRTDLLHERRALRVIGPDGTRYQVKTLRDTTGRRIELLAEAVQVSVDV